MTVAAINVDQPEVTKPPVVPLADGTNAENKEDGKSSSEEVPVGETVKDRTAPSETSSGSEHESPTKKLKLDSATDLQVTAEADENKPPSDSSTILVNNEEDTKGEEATLPEDKDAAEKDADGPGAGKDLGADAKKEAEEEDKTEAEKDPAAEAGKDLAADGKNEDKAEADKDPEAEVGKDLEADAKTEDNASAQQDEKAEAGKGPDAESQKEDDSSTEKDEKAEASKDLDADAKIEDKVETEKGEEAEAGGN